MKNLPEDELFDALENRLRNYNEEPDDEVWRKISGTLPGSRTPGWIAWSNRIAGVCTLAAVLFMLYVRLQERTEKNESLLSRSLKDQNPSVSKGTPEILPGVTDSLLKIDERAQDLLVREESGGLKIPESADSEKTSFLQTNLIDDTGDSGIPSTLSQSDFTIKSTVETSKDSVKAEQTVKTDTINKPSKKGTPRKEKKKRSGLTFYSMVTPLLSYYRVSPLSNDDVVIDKLNSPSIISANRLGINIEVGIQGKITKRLEYIAGISYYQQSQRLAYEQLTSDNVIVEEDADKSYMVRPGTIQKSFAYTMHNLGAQTGLLYSLKQDGLIHKAGIVINYQKGLQKSSDTEVYNNASSEYLNYQLIYRMEYRLKSGVSFFVQPTYMHSLYSKESIRAPFSLKQSRAGIGIGIVYSF